MKYLLILSLLLLPTISVAQELNLKVTQPEAEIIWKGLRKLPVEEVEVIMSKMRQQVSEQTQPKPAEPKPNDQKPSTQP